MILGGGKKSGVTPPRFSGGGNMSPDPKLTLGGVTKTLSPHPDFDLGGVKNVNLGQNYGFRMLKS